MTSAQPPPLSLPTFAVTVQKKEKDEKKEEEEEEGPALVGVGQPRQEAGRSR